MDDWGGTILHIQTEVEGQITVMRNEPGNWIPGGAPPEPSQNKAGTSAVRHPASGGTTDVPILVSMDVGFGVMPSRGLQGGWEN